MSLSPPVITIHYDMDTHEYVAQTIYADGKQLRECCRAPTLKQLVDDLVAWQYTNKFS